MARLPSAANLIKAPTSVRTPRARASAPNYAAALGRIANDVGGGFAALQGGLEAQLKADEKLHDHATQKALVDFRLATENDLDDYKREMQPGAAGWSESYAGRYKKHADKFVQSLPDERSRNLVQSHVTSNYQRLSSHAQGHAHKERDRFTEEGLENSLNGLVGRVDRHPDALRESRTMGNRIIDSSSLSQARKEVLRKRFRGASEKTAVQSRLARARTPEEFEAIKNDLRSHDADGGELDIGAERTAVSKNIFDTAPSAAQRRKIRSNGGIVVNLDTNSSAKGGQTSPMVVIPDDASPAERAAAKEYALRIEQIYKTQFGKSLPARIVTRSENGRGRGATMHTEPYSVKDTAASTFFNSAEGRAAHAQALRETLGALPGVHFSVPHDPKKGDHGAAGPAGNEVDFARGLLEHLREGGTGEVYNGPYKHLNPDQRRALAGEVERTFQGVQRKISKQIGKLEADAVGGYPLDEAAVNSLRSTVDGGATPELKAKFESAVHLSKLMTGLAKSPPAANEAYLNSIRSRFSKDGPTTEQRERFEKIEAGIAEQKRALKDDSLTWSMRSGSVPATPLDLSNESTMDHRLQSVEDTSKQFGVPRQYFTKTERTALAEQFKTGEASIGAYAVSLTQHWGAQHAQRALREISGQAPEAALLGGHVTTIGSTPVSKDAEEGLRLVKEKGYKPMPAPRQDVDSALSNAIGKTFVTMPKTWNAMRTLANAAYESRARKNAWTKFDSGEYEKVVRELTGEREENGIKYGGISYTKGGYLWGGTQTVIIPHDVRQDAFDDLREMVTLKDLKDKPVNAQGKVISEEEFSEASLITAGNGQYYLSAGDQDLNEVYRGKDGKPYIFRFDEVRPMLKAKRPDLFSN